ncbi:MAG: DHH family phosphoesterase [Thermoplasmata archaeon]|nr:MAG: DHH family phosphoesterase [Thermoplasmata archaeon]
MDPMKEQDRGMLENILDELKKGRKCVLLHENADPDALGSAAALHYAFTEVTIGAVEGLSKLGKELQKNLAIEVVEKPDLTKFDRIVVVDAPSPDRLGDYKDQLNDPIVIDHHSKTFCWEAEYCYVDDDKTSCAEIIYEILKLGSYDITPKIGLALLASIMSDTGKFSYANADTFRTFGEILTLSNLSMNHVLSAFEVQHETDYSRKISRLKGAQRLRFENVGEYIVASTQISAFESSVCNALISIGASIAFAGSQREDEFRISSRATPDMISKGLHLGNLMAAIGDENDCQGGGHNGAAGLSGMGDVEAMLNICLKRAKNALYPLLAGN